VGLDKVAVGQYLGEVGKPMKDTDVITDQDWFHKELLVTFCSSFNFERQTVLDGLRMFLSTFRLPGEAQMIDRILQAFSESVSRHCEEAKRGLFSPDEKRASDAAYLLSFSIIMLNTDLHNENIRANRKMKLVDFVRNNRNYGKDISDNDLPMEYLQGIYRYDECYFFAALVLFNT
jgi:brefeldin A-resistance guanine nucleotide exchange factor 1